ncbi:hypothetical protein GCM10011511_16040 [Puia dinghuensis]|uniref:Uncharacterized protein n=1 Tax=Puia dinghuensis TaxID=1792502 RepID=A0A8J2UB90_9BACT|nr:hypothetical protein GCM10011511_16040 [Puia dinghuensis]
MLQDYLEKRVGEIETRLRTLQNHWDNEMRLPFRIRRASFLEFLYDEKKKYECLLHELINIQEIFEHENI